MEKCAKMKTKVIYGRINDKVIQETIVNYNPDISAMVPTAKENIRKKFAALGYNPNEVSFDD